MAEAPAHESIEFDSVSLAFDGKAVLEGISFQLENGETKVILGASGSGKSLLLKLTLGLLRPDAGRICVLGEEITGHSEQDLFRIRKKIGMVFQEGALFDSLTIGENVGFALGQMPEIGSEELDRRVRETLRFVDLEQTVDLYPPELSGGMRRRVAIARAMVSRPQILLYDSPTAGLDPITAQRIVALVIKQRDLRGASALLVTHRLQDAFELDRYHYDPAGEKLLAAEGSGEKRETHTRFMVLRDGEIIFHGSLQELLAQRDPYLQKFLA